MIRLLGLRTILGLMGVAWSGWSSPGAMAQGVPRHREYTGANRVLSVGVPTAPNWAGVPYSVTALDTPGDPQYDKVMFHVDDFGQYLVLGVRVLPPQSVSAMNGDEPRTVLANLSQATLLSWRTDLNTTPEVVEESMLHTTHGEAISRVYRVKRGSFLTTAQGRVPTPEDVFDTNIASLVARQGAVVVFVLAQDDTSPDDRVELVRMARELLETTKVLRNR